MLPSVAPIAAQADIKLLLNADDFMIWKSGYDVQVVADILSSFINDAVLPWMREYNMQLSPGKCHSFLFSNYYHDS